MEMAILTSGDGAGVCDEKVWPFHSMCGMGSDADGAPLLSMNWYDLLAVYSLWAGWFSSARSEIGLVWIALLLDFCRCCYLHTFCRWPLIPHLRQFMSNAGQSLLPKIFPCGWATTLTWCYCTLVLVVVCTLTLFIFAFLCGHGR